MRRPTGWGLSGWRIIAYSSIAFAMTAPAQTTGVSVFVDPMMAALDLSRSQVAGAYLFGTLAGATALPLVGRWFDRFGARRATAVIAASFGAALIAMSTVVGLLTLAFGFMGIRLLGPGSLAMAATNSAALWFRRRRGLALGLVTAGGASLMSLAPLTLAAGIGWLDWRITWALAGGVVWAVTLPIAWWGLRDHPRADEGLTAFPISGGAGPVVAEAEWTRVEALRTAMFWAVTTAMAANSMIVTGLAFHQISLLGERGLSVTEAAANYLPQTAAGLAAMVVTGALVDRVRPRGLVAAGMGSLATALLLAQTVSPGLLAAAFGTALGIATGSARTLEATVFVRYFGVAHIGEIRGIVRACIVAASAFGPLAVARGHELHGSYGPVLTLLVAIPLGAAAFAALAPVPSK